MAATYTEVVEELDLRRSQVAGLKQQNADLLGALKTCSHALVDAVQYATHADPDGQHNAGMWNTAEQEARGAIEKAPA